MGISLVDDAVAMSYLYNVCLRKCEQSIFHIRSYMICQNKKCNVIASQDALHASVVTNNHNQGVGTSINITCDSTKHVQFT